MAEKITDFKDLVQQYADKIAKERGTEVKWVCIDGSQKHVKEKYPDKKVSVDIKDPIFLWDTPSSSKDLLFKDRVSNSGSSPVSTTVKRSESVSNTFSWSTTEGIKVGTEVKVTAKFAGFGAETKQSFEFNFSSTQGKSSSTTRTWEIDKTIITPPNASTELSWMLDRDKSEGTFTAEVTVSGRVAIWFKDKIDLNDKKGSDLHWLWFPTPASIIRKLKPKGFRAVGSKVIFSAVGNIHADVGLESQLQVNETMHVQDEVAIATALNDSEPTQAFIFNSDGECIQSEHLVGVSPREVAVV